MSDRAGTDRASTVPRVRLRDITLDDADLIDAWGADPAISGEFNDFGKSHEPVDRDALAKGPLRNERNGQLIIELVADARPIGSVGWRRVGYGPNPQSDGWNIGIALIPEARFHGYGVEAQIRLAAYLFETTGVNRVEAQTDVDNIAEQHALEKAGFQREGIARGAQFRAGAYHGLVAYSRLRDDPTR
jgi:Acetyltransferases, including N-acetylases of ribosomal proteins